MILKTMKTIKDLLRVVFIFSVIIGLCYMFRFMWLGAFQPLEDRIELISIGGYLKFGFGLSTFFYLAWIALCKLFDISINELKVYPFIGITALVIISSSLYIRSMYVSKIENAIYWECKKEITSSIYYTKFIYANDPRLCKE